MIPLPAPAPAPVPPVFFSSETSPGPDADNDTEPESVLPVVVLLVLAVAIAAKGFIGWLELAVVVVVVAPLLVAMVEGLTAWEWLCGCLEVCSCCFFSIARSSLRFWSASRSFFFCRQKESYINGYNIDGFFKGGDVIWPGGGLRLGVIRVKRDT